MEKNLQEPVPYGMVIILTPATAQKIILAILREDVSSIEETLCAQTERKHDGFLIIDVPQPDMARVKARLKQMPFEMVYDFQCIEWAKDETQAA